VREELTLDEKGFADVSKELARTAERVSKIRTDAAKRLEKAGGEGACEANAVLMLFEASQANENGSSAKKRKAGARR
jgi:hypothetical protein